MCGSLRGFSSARTNRGTPVPGMNPIVVAVLTVLAAYLFGAVPTGYLIARMKGVDILKQGSGNIGATNVGRVLGLPWGVLVFLVDCAKGALPVVICKYLLIQPDEILPPHTLPVLAGIAAFL